MTAKQARSTPVAGNRSASQLRKPIAIGSALKRQLEVARRPSNGDPSPEVLSLTEMQVLWVRDALLIGLDALAEVERLSDEVEGLRQSGVSVPEELAVIHPTGTNDAVGRMATALRTIEPL